MNVLVTGATGFVGARLVRHLRVSAPKTNIHIIARSTSNTWRLADYLDQITIHEGDVTDLGSLVRAVAISKPTHIYHFANAGVYGGVSATPARLLEVNTIGLAHLLEALRDTPYEGFVNIGSSSEYGLKGAPMRETDSCEPVNAYGISKLAATHLATLEALTYDKSIATFRLFSPFGPQDDASRLISKAIVSMSRGTPMRVPHPDAVRDYVYVDDAVELFADAAKSLARVKGEIFNVGGGIETRVVDVLSIIHGAVGSKSVGDVPVVSPLPASESPRWVADMEKTYDAFVWRPKHTVEGGLTKTIAWFRENPEQYL